MISEKDIREKFPVLTRTVFEDILKKYENDDAAEILSITGKDVGDKGDHYASIMYRIKVEYCVGNSDKETRSLSLLAKTLPEGEEMMKVVTELDSFPREMRMFRETLPKLQETLNEEFGAKAYYVNEEKNVLVLEDLAPRGFVMGDRRRGLDTKHCKLVLEKIAKFHAASIDLHAKDPQSVERYNRNAFDLPAGQVIAVKDTTKNLADVVEKWPENGKIYAEKLRKRIDTLMPDLIDAMALKANNFNVLNHGDVWLTNLLFRYNETSGEVEDVIFVDYQFSYYSSAAIDLQFLIQTSLEEEDRRGCIEELLQIYHRQLSESLRQLGHADKAITYEELLKEYKKLDMYGLYTIIFELPLMLSAPEDVCDLNLAFKNEGDSNSMYKRLTGEKYTNIIKKLIPVYYENGVL